MFVNTQSQGVGGKEKRVDVGGHVGDFRHKSLCTPIFRMQPGPSPMPQPSYYRNVEGGPEAVGRDIQRLNLIPPDLRPPLPHIIFSLDEGVV